MAKLFLCDWDSPQPTYAFRGVLETMERCIVYPDGTVSIPQPSGALRACSNLTLGQATIAVPDATCAELGCFACAR